MRQAWHQKNILRQDLPFTLLVTDINEFPPHWHEEMEVVYVREETLRIGLSNEVFTLVPRDIFLVGTGEVHYFLPQPKNSMRVIIQFDPSIEEQFFHLMKNKRISRPHIKADCPPASPDAGLHRALEEQILAMLDEYGNERAGHRMAMKARLYDLAVILLRHAPMEDYAPNDRRKQLNRLERLDQVFMYVEGNYHKEISLRDISRVANFSVYHFTRFFRDTTGMTFRQYLNNFRAEKAVRLLLDSDSPVTEIAFKAGFNSIKTFNRVFRQIKGCSPTQYKKSNF